MATRSCYTIACASVVAKVIRDRLMTRLAARYPEYGWERNSGYATREHRAAMRAYGLTPFHRRSFPAVHATIAGEQQIAGLRLAIEDVTDLDVLDALAEAELLAIRRPGRAAAAWPFLDARARLTASVFRDLRSWLRCRRLAAPAIQRVAAADAGSCR